MVLLKTLTYAKNDGWVFYYNFTLKYFVYLNLWFAHKVSNIYKILYMYLNTKNDQGQIKKIYVVQVTPWKKNSVGR